MIELRPYLRLLATYRGRMLLGSVLVFATIAAGVGLLALSGWFITATGVTALALAAGIQAQLDIYIPGAGIRFFALGRTAARYIERVQNHDTVLRLLADLRQRVFARLTVLDPAALARFRNALVLNRLTADIDALDSLYLRCLAPPAAAVLAVLGVAGLLALIAPAAGLAVGAVLFVGAGVVTVAVAWPGTGIGERVARRTESARTQIVDLVRGLAELRAFGVVNRQQAAIERSDRALVAEQQRAAGLAAVGEAGMGLVVHLVMALALFLGLSLYTTETLSGPLAVLMPLAVLALLEGLAPVPGGLLQLGRARAAARRLNSQGAVEPTIREPHAPAPPPETNELTFDHVDAGRGEAPEPILRDFSLHLAEGEHVAVVGPSGCGKSTLADLAVRLLDPLRGEVRLGDTALPALAQATVQARVSYATQRNEIFADTIAANLLLARPEADDRALWYALEVVALADFVEGLDRGLDTWVGESGVRLSGGQARRLALARIVLRDASVVVLDEPLAGLDAATAAEVAARLKPWLRGRTALLLAHDTTALPTTDRVVELQ
ncbi:thiol reductant ABC exporter subunit CydC [Halofilum ochraceum]|uniref:thiol reductant ABC exporter subunit CydC n=1 Tax=Halofilum ochraceum TaxID=1611323 RepID=UPI00082BDE20|nr:thiol reductant ABC exporter subunit CydC [Halofilum ochraceum]